MSVLYLLFVLSGRIKLHLSLIGIRTGIDITLLLAVILIIDVFVHFKRYVSYANILGIAFLLIFYLWMLITLFYTPSEDVAFMKSLYFIVNIIAFVYPIITRNFNIRIFFKSFIILSNILGAINIIYIIGYSFGLIEWETYQPAKSEYLHSGLYLGLSFIILNTVKINLFRRKEVFYLLNFTSILFLLLTGARGPILFTIIICIFYYMVMNRRLLHIPRYIKNTTFGILVASTFFLVFFSDILFNRMIMRFKVLFNSLPFFLNNNLENIRVEYLVRTFQTVFYNLNNFIFGKGVGSFGILIFGVDENKYPHNIIAEILFEFGFIGLILFSLFAIFSFHKLQKRSFLIFILLYIFLNLLKSYSLIDIRILFTLLAFTSIYKEPTMKNYYIENKKDIKGLN